MKILETAYQYHPHTIRVSAVHTGQRLDKVVSHELPQISRSQIQALIAQGLITCQDRPVRKSGQLVSYDQVITCHIPVVDVAALRQTASTQARELPVSIIYEHPDFMVINKPAGLTVHAACTTSTEVTLVDWLLAIYPDLAQIGPQERPGIVHRLDKDTSGLLIIPRTLRAHATFSHLFADRAIQKTYIGVVHGHPPATGQISLPIVRHPTHRTKMSARQGHGRPSLTAYITRAYGPDMAVVELHPHTGRTHQLRAHLEALNHPLVGDILYGGKRMGIARQALHAQRIQFTYNNVPFDISCPLPQDIQALVHQCTDTNI